MYSATAATVGGIATSSPSSQILGTGSWKNDPNATAGKMEFYLPLTALGSFTIDDIASLKFSTQKATPIPATPNLDFFWSIYTVGSAHGWYEERLTSEPMYYNNYNAPYDNWSTYQTASGTNQMTFFDSNHSPIGYSGAPTLAEIQANPINFNYTSPYWASGSGIDYGSQTVKYISISTGSASNAIMLSYLDNIIITLNNGKVLTIDLENAEPTRTTIIGTPTSTVCGIIDVPITVKDFTSVGAISLTLNYDPAVLSYQSVSNGALDALSNGNGSISGKFIYGNFPVPAVTLSQDAVLFTLHFNVLPAATGGSTTPLTWSTVQGECEYAGPGGEPVYTSTFIDLLNYAIPVRPVKNTTTGLEYCKIQDAIDDPLTLNGQTITVAAGTYPEQVTIDKSIHLVGASGAIIQAPAIFPVAIDPLSNIVLVKGSGISAEITGFVIRGGGPTNCGSMGRGVFVRDGATANIHDNQILNIRDNEFSGCQNGIAIQIGRNAYTTSGIATITNNIITGYQKGAIVVDNIGSNAIINGNTITGAGTTNVTAQNGIQISRGATATISGNTVTGNSFNLAGNASDWGACGILLYQSGAVSLIGGNNLSGNDNNYYATEVTGTLALGAEIFGALSAVPLTKGYQIILDANQNLDASLCTFETINPASASLTILFNIEDRIWHSVDNQLKTGFVRVKAANVYVTGIETDSHIQYGIDAASAGDLVNVKAKNYGIETAVNRSVFGVNGLHVFGLFIDKNNLTVKGYKLGDVPVASATEAEVLFNTGSTANFGPSGVFVQANGVTLEGLKIGDNIVGGSVSSNKTIEVIGDAFTMNKCYINTSSDQGAFYMGAWDASHPIVSYSITANLFNNTVVSINNGAGATGPSSGRIITGNTFTGVATPYLIGFRGWNGASPAQGWIVNPVGGALITGNTFNNTGVVNYIIARGNSGGYNNAEFNWSEIWTSNTFGNHVVTLVTETPFDVRSYNDGSYPETRRISPKIQENVNIGNSGDVVLVSSGTYPENLIVDKTLDIRGANYGISAGYTPGARGSESIIVGEASISATNVSFDGFEFESPIAATTKLVQPTAAGLTILFQNNVFDMKNQQSAAIYNDNKGSTIFTILNNKFKNQFYTGTYSARSIYAKNTFCTIIGNDFSNVELGVYLVGNTTDATTVSGNRFSVLSAAVLIGERQNIQILNNDFVSGGGIYCDKTSNLNVSNNFFGPSVSYAAWFISTIGSGNVLNNNSIFSAYTSGANTGKTLFNFSTTQTVTATCNWWGTTDPTAIAAKISGTATYLPWLVNGTDLEPATPGFQPSVVCDETPPALVCPADVTVNQHANKDPYATGYATATDNSVPITLTYNDDRSGLNLCNATGVITRTWSATDASGNTSTCVQNITVIDEDNPVVVVPTNITVNTDAGSCSAVVNYTAPTATDFGFFQGFENAEWLSGAYQTNPSTDWNDYPSSITRVASGSAAADLLVSKTGNAHALINSTANIPLNSTGAFCRIGGYNGTFGSGFVSSVDVYFDKTDGRIATGTYGWDLDQAVSNSTGGFLRDFIYHVGGDNTGIYVCVSNNSNNSLPAWTPNYIQSQPSFATITASGWYTMEWVALNNAGNLAMDFNIRNSGGTIVWTTTINTSDAIAGVGGNRYMWFNLIAADKLAIDNTSLTRIPLLTSVPPSGTAFAKGATAVQVTATDACSNTGTYSFTVTVNDVTPPVLAAAPAAVSVQCIGDVPAMTNLTWTDNCDVSGSVAGIDGSLSGTACNGTITRTWNVSDASGNAATQRTQIITVNDNTAPVITLPSNELSMECFSVASVDAWTATASALDACQGAVVVVPTYTAPTSNCNQIVTVTFTATDACSNTATATKTFTVNDVTAPVITVPPTALTMECFDAAMVLAWTNTASALDACAASRTVSVNYTAPTSNCNQTVTVTFSATDLCNNTATATKTFTVNDVTPPVITCPANITVNMNSGCTYVGAIGTASATDNCTATGSIVISNNAPTVFNEGVTTVIWTATDLCGKFSTCTQTVTVVINTISGNLTYYNTANTQMNNVLIELKQSGIVKYYTTTGLAPLTGGNYSFPAVCAGTYNVVFKTAKPIGGINATDAAQVNAWSVGPQYSIEKIRFFAGDVKPDILNNNLDAGDAGRILQYFVTAGNPAFSPNWSFWNAGETTIAQNPDSSLTLTVNGNLTNHNYYAMCKGDFNGSFTPGGLKSGSDHLTLNTRQNLQVNPGTVFELPVYAAIDMNVGAISLIMNFPSNKLEINGVYLSNNPGFPLQYNVTGNELRIGWNSLQNISLLNGDRLLTLMVKAKESVAIQDILFTLAADPLNELANENYNVINNALLTMDIINSTATVINNITLTENLTLSNHPNPFKGTTIFDYNLPYDGQVTLEIYDIVGKKIKNVLSETQTAGAHTLAVDANEFAAGVYTCTLQLKNKNSIKKLTIKIISK